MHVIYGEGVPVKMSFPGVEPKRMVDGDHGSTSITAIPEEVSPPTGINLKQGYTYTKVTDTY